MPKIDVANRFMVAANSMGLMLVRPPHGLMSYDDALVLAAWLVSIAEPRASFTFKEVLDEVQGT